MIWRQAYQPIVDRNFDAPSPLRARMLSGAEASEFQVLVGAIGLEAVPELGIWQRLFDEDAPGLEWRQGVFGTPRDIDAIEASLPRSQHDRTLILAPSPDWEAALQNEIGARTFCWCRATRLLVIGLPTEEVWEEILESLNRPLD